MAFKVKYHCGDVHLVGEDETADTLEKARELCRAKAADIDYKADFAFILRITVTGSEELEESRKLHA